ncbi:hypothetical protein N183_30515 [Sinorhizobium sp. Sb3]|uniref:hypothetical protein n=1 Tax=Sinorhizobium sp. Sb3 TaxID=1358417 RepID=UPI00071C603B|nr:hypothetical protein [Sinorhizobium sp. Sb3]KSV68943.1 hypothetical protein N183_30515 [Sinorhizobium sp. Sb3]
MADENETHTTETATPAEIAPPTKRRSRQPNKVALKATEEPSKAHSGKPGRGRRKNAAKLTNGLASVESVTKVKAKTAKGDGKTQASKQTTQSAAPTLDDIADLLQLEEENARLRKSLAEKLRAENADLRKRLGLT